MCKCICIRGITVGSIPNLLMCVHIRLNFSGLVCVTVATVITVFIQRGGLSPLPQPEFSP